MEPKKKFTTGKEVIIKNKVKNTNQLIKTQIREFTKSFCTL